MKGKRTSGNQFKTAVASTPQIKTAYRSGLQALGQYSKHIQLSNKADCDGSVDIDTSVKNAHPQANRWDFCLSYKAEAFFVEVHPAHTGEVNTVIKKLNWLKQWLREHAPEIDRMKSKSKHPYYWIQSNGFHILPGSPQFRQAIQHKIKPIARLNLN